MNGEERDKVSPDLEKRESYKQRKRKERKGRRSRDSDSLRPKEKKVLTEEEKQAKREKRLKERERRREERRIRDKLSQEVAVRKDTVETKEEEEEEETEANEDRKEDDNIGGDEVVVNLGVDSDVDPLKDVPDVDEAVNKELIDVDLDIDAIVANKNSYIMDNPLTPKKTGGDDDSSSGSGGDSDGSSDDDEEEEEEADESDKNNKSSTKSMGAVDSDFEDYGDNIRDHKTSIVQDRYNNNNLSDSIDFNNNEQINALKQFKMTMDGNDEDIDADYDWNGGKKDGDNKGGKGGGKDDYVGVDTYED
eukprot:CAMPEP_0201576302 /NCGR_PEP_ID=MMETSP0190_2-20130828/22043_1 /ASSEMBLY_ACC=CAM_ASM_000263 /TAXON_ID=37353 /ORGANISM="Rosalina sp." /LENGTH=305 /DNA_ID=CAMNT_0048007015 /DNA_START=289 /DNA_END=1206 /DNA_ORIENTATION=+